MFRLTKAAGASLTLLLTAALAACAPQQWASTPAAAAPPAASTTTPGATAVAPAPGDHQAMMAHCAEMRQQIRQGAPMSPEMQRMATYCQHMDHTMGAQRGRSGPYP